MEEPHSTRRGYEAAPEWSAEPPEELRPRVPFLGSARGWEPAAAHSAGEDPEGLEKVLTAPPELGVTVSSLQYERRLDDEKKPVVAGFDAHFGDVVSVPQLVRIIERVPGVRRVHVRNHV